MPTMGKEGKKRMMKGVEQSIRTIRSSLILSVIMLPMIRSVVGITFHNRHPYHCIPLPRVSPL